MIRHEVRTTVSFEDFDVVFSTCDDGAAFDRRPSKPVEPTEVVMSIQCGDQVSEVLRINYQEACRLNDAISLFTELVSRGQQ